MDIVYLLIPLSIVLAFLVGAAFWWALQAGQFEDLDGPAHRILSDGDSAESTGFGSERTGPRKCA